MCTSIALYSVKVGQRKLIVHDAYGVIYKSSACKHNHICMCTWPTSLLHCYTNESYSSTCTHSAGMSFINVLVNVSYVTDTINLLLLLMVIKVLVDVTN